MTAASPLWGESDWTEYSDPPRTVIVRVVSWRTMERTLPNLTSFSKSE